MSKILPSVAAAQRYREQTVDWDGLASAVHRARGRAGVEPGKPGVVEFQQGRAAAIEQTYFKESGLFQSRIAYAISNPAVDVDVLVEDLKATLAPSLVEASNSTKPGAIQNVTVLGGGPGGLAAAIALKNMGLDVTLVERKPIAERRVFPIFNSRINLFNDLEALGVYGSVMEQSSYTEHVVFRNMIAGYEASLEPLHAARGQGHLTGPELTELAKEGTPPKIVFDGDFNNLQDPISRPSRAQIAYGDMVHGLAERAQELGIHIVDEALADVVPNDAGKYDVVATRKDGTKVALGTPDRIVVAPGNLKHLGPLANEFTHLKESALRKFCAGLANIAVGSVQRRVIKQVGDDTLRTVVVGHGQRSAAWMLTQLPEGWSGDEADLARYWKNEVGEALAPEHAAQLSDDSIEFVSPKPFDVQLTRLRNMSANNQVLAIGDAAHKAHFLTSYGVHLAVGGDIQALQAHVEASNAYGEDVGFWEFDRIMQENAAVWCGGSLDEFEHDDTPWNLRALTFDDRQARPGRFARKPL
ncbi:MAG: NAD-binding protein [Deltaproteobacteria bacterium]|jgi:2-polyprenyl-6-methoxyphenol hydroxylase-like FAD-dependent oxidoreductase